MSAAREARRGRLLPAALRGPSRAAVWRRARLRKILAAVLVGAGVWLVLRQVLPAPADPPSRPVLVATADLPVGQRLTDASVQVRGTALDQVPPGSLDRPEQAVGRVLVAPVGRGEPVTRSRLRLATQLTALNPGMRAVHLPLADPSMPSVVQPGDRVDVVSVADGRMVATDLLVIWVAGRGLTGPNGIDAEDGGGDPGVPVDIDGQRAGPSEQWPGLGAATDGPVSGLVVAAPVDKLGELVRAAVSDTPSAGVHVALRMATIR